MRVLDHNNLESRLVEGLKGTLTALDVVGEDAFGVGLRVIPQHSKVPKPGTPMPRGRRVLFVLRGAGTVTNGEFYQNIEAGKFVLLDDGEFPTFSTSNDELVMLECRFNGTAKTLPPTIALTPPLAVETRVAASPPKTSMYESI